MEFKEKGQLISEERLRCVLKIINFVDEWTPGCFIYVSLSGLVSERRVEDSMELYNQLKEKGKIHVVTSPGALQSFQCAVLKISERVCMEMRLNARYSES